MRLLLVIGFTCWLLLPASLVLAGDNETVKKLANDLKSGNGRAAEGLVKQGAAAVGALTELLKKEPNLVKGHAAQALGRIGPAAKSAIPALSEAVADQDQTLAAQAALALGQIGLASVPALIQVLKDAKSE